MILYDWARYTCPTCHAAPQQRCRTLTTGRTTDAHAARLQLTGLIDDDENYGFDDCLDCEALGQHCGAHDADEYEGSWLDNIVFNPPWMTLTPNPEYL